MRLQMHVSTRDSEDHAIKNMISLRCAHFRCACGLCMGTAQLDAIHKSHRFECMTVWAVPWSFFMSLIYSLS